MNNWMDALNQHYRFMKEQYPDRQLMLIFDIDSSINDMQYQLFRALRTFDQLQGTHFFYRLQPHEIRVHEDLLSSFLDEYQLEQGHKEAFLSWYTKYRKTSRLRMRPMKGAIETMCWFQMQPKTAVGLKNICSEDMQLQTIRVLKKFGKEFNLKVANDMLFFPKDNSPSKSALESLAHFRSLGYHVICFVDSDNQSLDAIASEKDSRDILLLQADTVYRSKNKPPTTNVKKGSTYELHRLIDEKDVPLAIDLVWHGINDRKNMQQFFASSIKWGEVDVQAIREDGTVLLQHDSVEVDEMLEIEKTTLSLGELLTRFRENGKSVKIDFKDKTVLSRTIRQLKKHGFEDEQIWLNGDIDVLKEAGFTKLRETFPNAIRQTSVDFLSPVVFALPGQARAILDMLAGWGINRLSISWELKKCSLLLQQLKKWRFEINIYNAPDLEQFLKVMILSPRSITSDFNFPEWNYYGKGSGKDGKQVKYIGREVKVE